MRAPTPDRAARPAAGIAAACALIAGCAALSDRPPARCGIEVDGRLSEREWSEARRIPLDEGVTLLVAGTRQELCLGFLTAPAGLRYVDLYVAGDLVRNLRASLQLGERVLSPSGWGDTSPPWIWGNNVGWTANRVERRLSLGETGEPLASQVAPYEGFEFVLDRAGLPDAARLRVEIRDLEGRAPDIVWPAGSTRTGMDSWGTLAALEDSAADE